jgi:hypothetical protein
MATYTTAHAAVLATLQPEHTSHGIRHAEITYQAMSPEAFWADEGEASDLVLDELGLTPGEYVVERGVMLVDAEGTRSENLSISRA